MRIRVRKFSKPVIRHVNYGIRLASDEPNLESREFVEATLENAGEVYEPGMRMQSAGIDLSEIGGGKDWRLAIGNHLSHADQTKT